ncbi:MAG: hypothetical protein GY817_00385, partial [bacterium]|nr:hypothetical protein [bacterium]
IRMPDGTRKEIEEEVPVPDSPEERTDAPEEKPNEEERVTPMEVTVEEALPLEPEEKPAEEDTFVDEHGRVVRKTITVRKRIVRRIIRMPDGTRKEVEEEVPVSDSPEERTDTFEVIQREEETPSRPKEPQYVVEKATEAPEEVSAKEPRHVERVYVTRILRQRDGTERVLETSETVSPMQPERDDEEPESVEDVKDNRGRVTKTVTRSPVFVERRRKVVKKSRVMPDGKEEPEETRVVEPEETKEITAPVIRRVVKRVVHRPDGKDEVVEEEVHVKPFEVIETKEDSKPEVTEKRERGKTVKTIKRKIVETRQQNITKKVTRKPNGKEEAPIEEEVIKPVEPVNYRIVRRTVRHPDGTEKVTEEPEFDMPDDAKEPSVEEVKDRRGTVVRRITTKPVPMITTRKVYRTIIIAPDGREESVQERVEERGQPGQPEPERQAPEEKEEPEEETVVTPMEVPVEEALPVEPEEQPEEKETFVDEYGRVVRKTITVRKRIVRRIIRMPDGTRKEIEEEVPVPDSPEERTDAPEEKPNEEERVTPMEVTVEE